MVILGHRRGGKWEHSFFGTGERASAVNANGWGRGGCQDLGNERRTCAGSIFQELKSHHVNDINFISSRYSEVD